MVTYDYWILKTDSIGNHSMAKYHWRKWIMIDLIQFPKPPMEGIFWEDIPIPTFQAIKRKIVNGSYDYWIVKITDKYNFINR